MREDQPLLLAARAARETESSRAAGDASVFVSSVSCYTSNAEGLIGIREHTYLNKDITVLHLLNNTLSQHLN